MDLEYCLYCEKHLTEQDINFCSVACQTKEAAKPNYYNEYHHPTRLYQRRLSFSSTISSTSTSSSYTSFYSFPKPHKQDKQMFLFTESSIILLDKDQRIQDLSKNCNQNAYTNHFFS